VPTGAFRASITIGERGSWSGDQLPRSLYSNICLAALSVSPAKPPLLHQQFGMVNPRSAVTITSSSYNGFNAAPSKDRLGNFEVHP